MRVYFLLLISISAILFSCEKQEIPLPPRVPGDVSISQVNMGSEYSDQIYYSLKDDEVVSQNLKSIWDLSFETSDDGWHILINSSKGMKVAFYENATFEDDLVLADAVWKYDASTGNLDSTAIGDWREVNGIYLVDRGYDHLGNFQGNQKFTVIDVNAEFFTIKFSQLDGSSTQSIEIPKNKSLNYTQFSFDNEVVSVEPDKYTWDLLFTQYTYVFYEFEEVIPYQVTGVLINPNSVMATMEDNLSFDDIDLEFALNSTLNSNRDAIGYDWKYYKLDEGYYVIYLNQIYIIKDVDDVYYKLHFTDFYSDSGVKGSPKFEFQKL